MVFMAFSPFSSLGGKRIVPKGLGPGPFLSSYTLNNPSDQFNFDGFVRSPSAALRFNLATLNKDLGSLVER
jgi:hypothetical protein